MRDGVDSERTQARIERVRDDRNCAILNGTNPIALKSLERCTKGPKPLFRSQVRIQ